MKYKVRIEIEVDSIDFAQITVEASNVEEAKQLAIEKYEDNPSDFDVWASDSVDSRVDMNQIDEWSVEEIKE